MILVTVGSSANGFDRIVKMIDELKKDGDIKDSVIIQIGKGAYIPKNVERFFRFTSWDEILYLNKKARIIISHAGAGTILTALRYSKPIICVPRLKDYGEHTDNHQLEVAKTLNKEDKILLARNKQELLDNIKKIKRGWKPRLTIKDSKTIKKIQDFIRKI